MLKHRHVIAAILLMFPVSCSASPSDDSVIVDSGSRGGVCQSAAGDDWATRQAVPTMFGLESITVTGSQVAVVESVEPIANTGVRIVRTAFVKGGGVGSGSAYGDLAFTAGADSWAGRIEMPQASLPPAASGAGDSYQVVVAVVPTAVDGGSARGVYLAYRIGDKVMHLTGSWGFAVVKTDNECPKFSGNITTLTSGS